MLHNSTVTALSLSVKYTHFAVTEKFKKRPLKKFDLQQGPSSRFQVPFGSYQRISGIFKISDPKGP